MGIRSRIKGRLRGLLGQAPEPAPPSTPSPVPRAPEPVAEPTPAPAPVAAPPRAAVVEKEVAEDKVRRAVLRAKKGTLKKLDEMGGEASLAELHDHSERRFFIAHRAFSNLMEELTDQGLVDFDHDTGTTRMLPGGRQWLEINP